MKHTLWTRDFARITLATALGAAGNILAGFALSFLVFDETGSTLAAALSAAVQLFPGAILPLFLAPVMDRYPRKPFLVGGDIVNSVLFALAGVYLLRFAFSYVVYLGFSLLLACLSAFDELAYNSFYPLVLPEGEEERGYTVAAMLYPVIRVVMMPVAALLFDTLGVARILLVQAALSAIAAVIESRIRVAESVRAVSAPFSARAWWRDIRETAAYLKDERGLRAIYAYQAVTNGMGAAWSPLLVAFFRTAPGMTTAMYSLLSVAEFAGRSLGGVVRYRRTMEKKKRFGFIFLVYRVYETMDALLLWLPYPLMLVNRALCGFLGINSATVRQSAVQRYLPDALRARANAFESVLVTVAGGILSLLVGALGEVMDYRLCVTLCGATTLGFCYLTIYRERAAVKDVLEGEREEE